MIASCVFHFLNIQVKNPINSLSAVIIKLRVRILAYMKLFNGNMEHYVMMVMVVVLVITQCGTLVMVRGEVGGAIPDTSGNADPNARQQILAFFITEPNPVEPGRTVLQCDSIISNSQQVQILRTDGTGTDVIAYNGTLQTRYQNGRYRLVRVPLTDRVVDQLTIDPVCKQDKGTFTCAVKNEGVGLQKSVSISSVVDYDFSNMCSTTGPIVAFANDVLDMTCSCNSGSVGVSLAWTKADDSPVDGAVPRINHLNVIIASQFQIFVTDNIQGASYRCTASVATSCGASGNYVYNMCSVGPITVITEPQVTVSLINPIKVGSMAQFRCSFVPNITSSGVAEVSWYTQPTVASSRVYISSTSYQRMILQTVIEEDDGLAVSCTVLFGNGKQGTGELLVDIPLTRRNSSIVVESTSSRQATSSTSGTIAPPSVLFLFGSYPLTIAIISATSVCVALLIAFVVFCCCRCRHRRRKRHKNRRQQPRLSPSTYGNTAAAHGVPGSGTDGMYMYSTISDPDEQWGAVPRCRETTMQAVDSPGYQEPTIGGATPPVYTQIGSPFTHPEYMETNIDLPPKSLHVAAPGGVIGNALYTSVGYVEPEITDQKKIDDEMVRIRSENSIKAGITQAAPFGPATTGYLAIGEIPQEVRTNNARDKTQSALYVDIN